MGTPPREVLATVDRGSEIFWLQCKPCQDCYNQTGPIFNPARSSSFRTLPCSSPVCRDNYLQCSNNNSSSRSNNTCATSAPRVCVYTVGYGGGSVSQGNLSEDTLVLTSASTRKPYYITGFAFGCGHINKGLFAGSAGILGLGRGKLSVPSQLLMIYRVLQRQLQRTASLIASQTGSGTRMPVATSGLELKLVSELAGGATVHLHAQESTNASLLLCQGHRCGSGD
jgi:hypothetical protein